METINRFEGVAPPEDTKLLHFLYETAFGRGILRLLSARWVSRLCGSYLSSRLSCSMIKKFVKKNGIDLSLYEKEEYRSFNDFFTRKIRPELRPIDLSPDALIAPCDGLLSVYPITEGHVIPVKQSEYTVADLLQDAEEAKRFDGGVCMVFRLCVHHYHRYAFADDGVLESTRFLKGRLHTVRPIALRNRKVFCENAREVSYFQTEHLGRIAQIEVGALLVGKIKNNPIDSPVKRGAEKGRFLYGGSTVILLLEKGRVTLPKELFEATEQSLEVPVEMGMRLGKVTK